MPQPLIQLNIPFDLLVAAIVDLPPEEKLKLKQILTESEIAAQSSDPYPSEKDPERVKMAVDRLNQAVKQASSEMGITEDEFADLFDLSKSLPL
jgi:hypothetical protein